MKTGQIWSVPGASCPGWNKNDLRPGGIVENINSQALHMMIADQRSPDLQLNNN